jgi:TPR repeat protein
MLIRKIILMVGLCVLFTGCSTGMYGDIPGRPKTTADMGVRYLLGRGVPQSDERAFYYFSKAAGEGDLFAQNELAYMYAAGKGTSRNYSKALELYQKAAHQGLASAQYNLGLMYENGLGTTPNKALAREWYQKSAEHGFEPAKQALDGN